MKEKLLRFKVSESNKDKITYHYIYSPSAGLALEFARDNLRNEFVGINLCPAETYIIGYENIEDEENDNIKVFYESNEQRN